MPDADIKVTTMNGIIMLTGTVKQPEEASDAADLVTAFSGGQSKVVNRIKTATPLQINLQVRVAEVSRSLSKEISGNLQGGKPGTNSSGDPYFFGLGRGRDFTTGYNRNISGKHHHGCRHWQSCSASMLKLHSTCPNAPDLFQLWPIQT